MFVWKDENKQKEADDGPFLRKAIIILIGLNWLVLSSLLTHSLTCQKFCQKTNRSEREANKISLKIKKVFFSFRKIMTSYLPTCFVTQFPKL